MPPIHALLRRVRRPGPLVAVSIVYLALVSGVMIWRGISVSPDYLLLILVPVAVLSGRFVAFLRDWVPFVALFLGYEALRGVAPKLGIKPQVASMVHIEKAVFFGRVPSQVLQRHFGGLHALVVAATVIYFCHFLFPIAAGMVLWLTDRVQFLRFTAALLAMSFAAFIVFLLLPTAPPWYANQLDVLPGVHDLVNGAMPSAVSPYYRWLNPDAVAAWPSLHSAYPALGALALYGISRRTAFITVPWCLAMWFSVIFLGEHYAIDVLGGIAFALISWALMLYLVAPHVAAFRAKPAMATIADPGLDGQAHDAGTGRPQEDGVQHARAPAGAVPAGAGQAGGGQAGAGQAGGGQATGSQAAGDQAHDGHGHEELNPATATADQAPD